MKKIELKKIIKESIKEILLESEDIKLTPEETKLKDFFETEGFSVYNTIQDDVTCAEVESWTDGGVDMIIWLNPFTIEEFKSYVDDFDVDDVISSHREDPRYCKVFTIRQSLNDFEEYYNGLKKLADKLK